jgi:hypothetical protein
MEISLALLGQRFKVLGVKLLRLVPELIDSVLDFFKFCKNNALF